MVTFSPEFQTFLDLAGAEVVADSLPFDQKGVVLRIAEITWTVAHNQNDNYGYSLARNEYGPNVRDTDLGTLEKIFAMTIGPAVRQSLGLAPEGYLPDVFTLAPGFALLPGASTVLNWRENGELRYVTMGPSNSPAELPTYRSQYLRLPLAAILLSFVEDEPGIFPDRAAGVTHPFELPERTREWISSRWDGPRLDRQCLFYNSRWAGGIRITVDNGGFRVDKRLQTSNYFTEFTLWAASIDVLQVYLAHDGGNSLRESRGLEGRLTVPNSETLADGFSVEPIEPNSVDNRPVKLLRHGTVLAILALESRAAEMSQLLEIGLDMLELSFLDAAGAPAMGLAPAQNVAEQRATRARVDRVSPVVDVPSRVIDAFSPEFHSFLTLAGAEVLTETLPFTKRGVVLQIHDDTFTIAVNDRGYSLARNKGAERVTNADLGTLEKVLAMAIGPEVRRGLGLPPEGYLPDIFTLAPGFACFTDYGTQLNWRENGELRHVTVSADNLPSSTATYCSQYLRHSLGAILASFLEAGSGIFTDEAPEARRPFELPKRTRDWITSRWDGPGHDQQCIFYNSVSAGGIRITVVNGGFRVDERGEKSNDFDSFELWAASVEVLQVYLAEASGSSLRESRRLPRRIKVPSIDTLADGFSVEPIEPNSIDNRPVQLMRNGVVQAVLARESDAAKLSQLISIGIDMLELSYLDPDGAPALEPVWADR
jgi:hypothetical protein